MAMLVDPKEREVLRNLAGKIAAAATLPAQAERRKLWLGINSLKPARPVVFCSPEGAWEEILPPEVLQCQTPLLRRWELQLRQRLYAWEHFDDDAVLDDYFNVAHVCQDSGWGLEARKVYSDSARGAYYWYGSLRDKSDLEKLHSPKITIDRPATEQNLALAENIFSGLMHVRLKSSFWWSLGLIGELAQIRGLEQIMLDMCEQPQFVHAAMRRLQQGRQEWLDDLEAQGLLSLNNGNDYVGSGGFGWSEALPPASSTGQPVRTNDMWGFAEAQEITGVSPAMHDEFVLQYQKPLLKRFGLNCYGCCEPLHHKFGIVLKVPRLRRISISPWCDRAIAAATLQDKYIFSWKPHPAYLADIHFDADAVRANIRETLRLARGCVIEMILKDTHTCNHQPERFDQWCRVAKEEAERG